MCFGLLYLMYVFITLKLIYVHVKSNHNVGFDEKSYCRIGPVLAAIGFVFATTANSLGNRPKSSYSDRAYMS